MSLMLPAEAPLRATNSASGAVTRLGRGWRGRRAGADAERPRADRGPRPGDPPGGRRRASANPAQIDDIVQETLSRVMAARSRVERDTLAPYAVATARNLIASGFQREQRARQQRAPARRSRTTRSRARRTRRSARRRPRWSTPPWAGCRRRTGRSSSRTRSRAGTPPRSPPTAGPRRARSPRGWPARAPGSGWSTCSPSAAPSPRPTTAGRPCSPCRPPTAVGRPSSTSPATCWPATSARTSAARCSSAGRRARAGRRERVPVARDADVVVARQKGARGRRARRLRRHRPDTDRHRRLGDRPQHRQVRPPRRVHLLDRRRARTQRAADDSARQRPGHPRPASRRCRTATAPTADWASGSPAPDG